MLGNEDHDSTIPDLIAYEDASAITVSAINANMTSVAIYDLAGRLLYRSEEFTGNLHRTPELQVANQTLLVKVTLADQKVITKKVQM
jgi:hypothetical protein